MGEIMKILLAIAILSLIITVICNYFGIPFVVGGIVSFIGGYVITDVINR